MDARELTASRLRLVPVGEQDIGALHAMLTNAAVRRYLCDDKLVPRSFAEDLVRNSRDTFESHGMGLWLIQESANTTPIGFCLLRPPDEHPLPELLYALLPSAWGRGLAIEAARAVIHYAFTTLECVEILAEMDEPNSASARVAEKIGMTFVGTRPGPAYTLLRYTVRRDAAN
jgi:ribosomal-protein-alanine N-acetyltransferase